ncbi:MAG: hypothetical protein H7A00_09260 [Hahellaceae bacterium]|nr:hypothetical protein [Hahellaceae bacterium]
MTRKSISIDRIIGLYQDHENIALPSLAEQSWFGVTWLSSYVWTKSVLVHREISFEEFVAHTLKNDPTAPYLSPDKWLPNCFFDSVDREVVSDHIKRGIADLNEARKDPDFELVEGDIPLNDRSVEQYLLGYCIVGTEKPCNKNQYGPTNIYVWQSGDWFHYCEIHNES